MSATFPGSNRSSVSYPQPITSQMTRASGVSSGGGLRFAMAGASAAVELAEVVVFRAARGRVVRHDSLQLEQRRDRLVDGDLELASDVEQRRDDLLSGVGGDGCPTGGDGLPDLADLAVALRVRRDEFAGLFPGDGLDHGERGGVD